MLAVLLHQVSEATGRESARIETNLSVSCMVAAAGVLYIGGTNGVASFSTKGQHQMHPFTTSSSACTCIATKEELLFVGQTDGLMTAFEVASGQVMWSISCNCVGITSCVVIAGHRQQHLSQALQASGLEEQLMNRIALLEAQVAATQQQNAEQQDMRRI